MTPTVFAAVRDDQGRVLLVRRNDSGNWELPGGRVELGETAITAVKREVSEESGVAMTARLSEQRTADVPS
jgi:ADP-ribose pyrophosphatase YjhB (NUDIX family)